MHTVNSPSLVWIVLKVFKSLSSGSNNYDAKIKNMLFKKRENKDYL